MANIYDKSSLVLIPSGTKTGKIFSQKPVSGDGDFTFTRASAATRVNADGNIEKETGNLLLQSNQFDTTWYAGAITLTSGQSGYDGSSDAWSVVPNTSSASHYLEQSLSFSGVYTMSVYAKANGYNYIFLWNSAAGKGQFFNLANGTIASPYLGGGIDATITSAGGGWYKCTFTFSASGTGNNTFFASNVDNAFIFAGNGTDGILIQDAQLEQGLVARDYIETTTAAVYGGITDNTPRLDYTDSSCPALLLEPLRTNIISYSEYLEGGFGLADFVSVSLENVTAPDGSNLVTKLQANGDTSGRAQDNLGVLGANHIYSGFFKGTGVATRIRLRNNQGSQVQYDIDASGNFTLAFEDAVNDNYGIEDFGNGWQRIWFETATSASSSNYFQIYPDNNDGDGSVYAWGIQAEEGSYATSYIPTYGSSVSRTTESAYITTNVDDLVNNTEGSIYMEIEPISVPAYFERVLRIDDGTDSNVIRWNRYGTINLQTYISNNGVQQANFDLGYAPKGANLKICLVYGNNDVRLYVNGSLLGTDTSATMTSVNYTRIMLANNTAGSLLAPQRVSQIILTPTKLSSQEAIDLTTI